MSRNVWTNSKTIRDPDIYAHTYAHSTLLLLSTRTATTAPSLTVHGGILQWGDTDVLARPKVALATHGIFQRCTGRVKVALHRNGATRRTANGFHGDCRKECAIKGCGLDRVDDRRRCGSRVVVATTRWTRRRLASHGMIHFLRIIGIRLCFRNHRQC